MTFSPKDSFGWKIRPGLIRMRKGVFSYSQTNDDCN